MKIRKKFLSNFIFIIYIIHLLIYLFITVAKQEVGRKKQNSLKNCCIKKFNKINNKQNLVKSKFFYLFYFIFLVSSSLVSLRKNNLQKVEIKLNLKSFF